LGLGTYLDLRRERTWALAVFVLSLVVRVVALGLVSDVGIHFPKYPFLAQDLRANHFLAPYVFGYCPLYVYVLAFLSLFTGGSVFPVLVLQVLWGSAGASLAYLIARRFTGRATAVLTGVLFAFSRSMVLHEVTVLADSLGTVLELATVYALFLCFEKATVRRWALSGLFLGLATTVRPTYALALVGIVPALWVRAGSSSRREKTRFAAALVGVVILVTLPFTLQNAIVSGDFVPVVSQGGYVFYTGNNYASSAVRYAPPPLLPAIAQAGIEKTGQHVPFYDDALSRRIASSLAGRDLSPSECSRYYTLRALGPMGRYPGAFVKLVLRKLVGVVTAYEVHDTLEANLKRRDLAGMPLIPYGWIFSLALVGVFVARHQWRTHLPLYILAGTQVVSLLVFYVVPRFRLPLEAMLIFFSALAIEWCLAHPRQRIFQAVVGIAAAAALSYVPRTEVMKDVARDQAIQNALARATAQAERGDLTHAAEEVERITTLVDDPGSPLLLDAHRQLAELYRRTGDNERASLEENLAEPPPMLEQVLSLSKRIEDVGACSRMLLLVADKFREGGKWNEAKDYLLGAFEIAPENPVVRFRLAEAEMATGETVNAIANLEQSLDDGLDFTRYGMAARYQLWTFHRDREPERAEVHRQAYLRMVWIYDYLTPGPGEARALREMQTDPSLDTMEDPEIHFPRPAS
jgi:4-amino-4-deoxy-L-arabinose transferase-like glycosyltransferase